MTNSLTGTVYVKKGYFAHGFIRPHTMADRSWAEWWQKMLGQDVILNDTPLVLYILDAAPISHSLTIPQ